MKLIKLLTILFFLIVGGIMAQTVQDLPTREQIAEKYKWDLTLIYKSDADWEKDFEFITNNMSKYKNFEGKLTKSAKELYKALKFDEEMGTKLDKLSLYSSLSRDLDLTNSKYIAMSNKLRDLRNKLSEITAFWSPELTSLKKEKLEQFYKEEPKLLDYKKYFDNILRFQPHVLTTDKEIIVAQAQPVFSVPYEAFNTFVDAELEFPIIKDENGQDIKISQGRYGAAMASTNRDYRIRFYKNFYIPFMQYKNTLATLLLGNAKANISDAKIRKYPSARYASLFQNNIPESVYDNLVNTCKNNANVVHRWVKIRKNLLKVDEYHPYDNYVTLFPSVKEDYTYDRAVEIVKEALKPFGEDYMKNLQLAFDHRRIDVYETKAKRSGAYSSGTTYKQEPYVLLNWNGTLNDVFTFAHEMGHNMHSYYTGLYQPYQYANYSIFLAEVASTLNEALLQDYLIKNAKTKEEKLALIEKAITGICATFFRQTAFADFEHKFYKATEEGQPLTADDLTKMYKDIYQQQWGPEMVVDEEEAYTWARVPHFYYNFYVYQYATSYAASLAIMEKYKKEGPTVLQNYIEKFLKAGSSKYPIDVLKDLGVDMNDPKTIKAVINRMNELMDEMETLLKQ
ncbi:MAG TPA: oligoendopeptidase F [Ignavibacteriales bacterium]|nr:oligoendopeptidase F [Ignavibacteriales bacterium]